MASSGASSGSSSLNHTSCSDEELHALLDQQRKRKRMISNRESARRSRLKKRKQIDDLIAESSQLRSENKQIESSIAVTKQRCMRIETENSVLSAQADELERRLESLNEIISFMSPMGSLDHGMLGITQLGFGAMLNHRHQQPVMASVPDVFQC